MSESIPKLNQSSESVENKLDELDEFREWLHYIISSNPDIQFFRIKRSSGEIDDDWHAVAMRGDRIQMIKNGEEKWKWVDITDLLALNRDIWEADQVVSRTDGLPEIGYPSGQRNESIDSDELAAFETWLNQQIVNLAVSERFPEVRVDDSLATLQEGKWSVTNVSDGLATLVSPKDDKGKVLYRYDYPLERLLPLNRDIWEADRAALGTDVSKLESHSQRIVGSESRSGSIPKMPTHAKARERLGETITAPTDEQKYEQARAVIDALPAAPALRLEMARGAIEQVDRNVQAGTLDTAVADKMVALLEEEIYRQERTTKFPEVQVSIEELEGQIKAAEERVKQNGNDQRAKSKLETEQQKLETLIKDKGPLPGYNQPKEDFKNPWREERLKREKEEKTRQAAGSAPAVPVQAAASEPAPTTKASPAVAAPTVPFWSRVNGTINQAPELTKRAFGKAWRTLVSKRPRKQPQKK